MSQPPELRHLVPVPSRGPRLAATDASGWDLAGRPRTLRLERPGSWTLLLFLGSHCDSCLPFWPLAAAPLGLGLEPEDAAVIVTRGPSGEDAEALAALASLARADPAQEPTQLYMSDEAWRAYRVHGAPFFVLLDGTSVVTEGVAWSVEQVAADVARARRPARR